MGAQLPANSAPQTTRDLRPRQERGTCGGTTPCMSRRIFDSSQPLGGFPHKRRCLSKSATTGTGCFPQTGKGMKRKRIVVLVLVLTTAAAALASSCLRNVPPGLRGLWSTDGRIMMGLVNYETYRGDFSRGPKLALEAVRLDPLNATTHMFAGRTFWFSGDLIKAIELFRKAAQLSPGIASAQANLAAVLVTAGRFEEALIEAQKETPSGYRDTALAAVYAKLGRAEESDRALSDLLSKGEQWGFQIAVAYAARGYNDNAFRWLERALELHDSGLPSAKAVPLLRALHDDPRWPVFLKKIGHHAG